jgi:glutathione synthase/RimK-type ligase-like ATP-grasp enzyme
LLLIVTHSRDLSAELVIRHLHKGQHKYLRLDTDKLGTPSCYFGFRSEPELNINGRTFAVSDVSAVWARRFALPTSLGHINTDQAEFVRRELIAVMDSFLEGATQAFYINTSHADRLAGNRLLQAQRAKQFGFSVPDSLATQDADRAREFLHEHSRAVTKAISFGRISSVRKRELVAFSSPVPENVDLTGLEWCPSLFQEMIPKRFDWRITTIGERVFSARTYFDPEASPIDWRQDRDASRNFVAAELPGEIRNRLLMLCAHNQIVYGAHDLIETPAGEFFFLETNPAGQWGWLALTLKLPIGQAIAEELVNRSGKPWRTVKGSTH